MRWRCFVFKQNFLSSREIKTKNQTMNRTFQSKVGWWYWIVIGITSVLLFFFFWEHYLLCTILCATVVVFEIEMLVHTQYVITGDGWLKVETGRFIPNASLEIDQILRIRKVRSMTFWQPALSFERLEVVFKKQGKVRSISLSPKNQEDFIRCLLKKNEAIQFYD